MSEKRKIGQITQKLFALFMMMAFLIGGVSSVLGDNFRKTGTTGFVFLEVPVASCAVGLGETGISLTNAGADGLFINPALIALSENRTSATLTIGSWYLQTSHQAMGITRKIPMIGTFGFQAVYFNFGEMEQTRNLTADEFGSYASMGKFSANAYSLGLTYARQLTDKFTFGTTLKYVRETISEYYADNAVMDLGFVYRTGFNSLRIGTFLQNFGLETKYYYEKFKMPQQLKLGISGEVFGEIDSPTHVTLLAEAVHPNDQEEHIHLGAEASIRNLLILRGGYKLGYDNENLTLGLGVRFVYQTKKFQFDMAYANHRYLENTIRYTLSTEL